MNFFAEVNLLKRFMCFFTLTVVYIPVYSQLTANFTASVQQGCGPLSVQFKDLSTGNPTEWLWNLGNGAVSTDSTPGAIYITPGTYTVTLTVKNASGENTITKTAFITVNPNPSVSFTATPLEGCAPLNVSFSDKSLPATGTITSWVWDFGDGTTSNLQNPSHTYNVSDTFNVTLSVTNSAGCKQIAQSKDLIKIGSLVKAAFTYNYTNVCKPPATVFFQNTSVSNESLNYQWDFGDGSNSTALNPTHVYTATGNFIIKLVARNPDGCSDVYQQAISVGLAKANFTYTNTCINQPVIFTDASSPKPIAETWDFGDGTTKDGDIVSHLYNGKDTFVVTLTANFGNCTDVIKKTIITGQKPTADFTISGNVQTCTYPVTLHFKNTSKGGVQYKWIFGDGTTSDASDPDHTYQYAGKYSVTLITFNANGCPDTLIRDGVVELGPPKILGIDSLPFKGCAPKTVTFRPDIFAPDPITSYKWTFGDGTSSTDSIPQHTYIKVGTYTVTLLIATAKGCTDSIAITDAVSVGKRPDARFAAEPLQSCAGNKIQFTDSSKGAITEWQWFFGDGGSSSDQNPLYLYTDTGKFSVTLVVSDYGCYDTLVRQDYVYLKPPVAKFDYSSQCSLPLVYQFNDSSIGAKTWLWNFGDGNTSKSASPLHSYKDTGIYNISLTVTNDECTYTKYDTIKVVDEHPSFTFKSLHSNFCKYDSVKFFATNYQPENIKSFYWDFGDSITLGFSRYSDTVYHSYTASGIYTPQLIVKDINDCIDTVNKKVQLNIYGPVASFLNKSADCVANTVSFTDQSRTDGIHPIKQWIWNFGDGSGDDTLTTPFTHTYTKTGYYSVSLRVTDANGCYDTIQNIGAIGITQPVADFVVDSLSCTGNLLQFTDSSLGVSNTYNWNFGDGNVSADANPQHIYNAEGIYNIGLTVTDVNGCKDSLLKPAYIKVVNPFAGFTIPDSLFTCPPAKIATENFSKNFASVLWEFGDGNTSSELNPVHFYTGAGDYVLTLVAQGYGTSCVSSVSKNIVLRGPRAKLNYNPFSGCNPLSTTFSASAKNTVAYEWDFGDGGTQTTADSTQQYTYTSTGKFLPKLIVIDSGGCRVSVENTDTITVYGSNAKFGINQSLNGCDSLKVNFIDSSTALFDNIQTYNWKFGDGDSSSLTNPFHSYKQTGLYNSLLTVTTKRGCVSDYMLPLNINIAPKPIISAVIPDSTCVFSSLTLNADVSNNNPSDMQWRWYLGNGDSALIQNPTYTYSSSGIFPVKLVATSLAGCSDSLKQNITINSLPVVNAGNDSVICLGKNTMLSPSGAQSYNWLQNTSLSCTDCTNPVAQPLQTTRYYVSGKNSFGCVAADSVLVQVVQPAKVLLSSNDSVCAGNKINLSASGEDVYAWQPANLVSPATGAQTSSTPLTTTAYTVIGSDIKGCFSDTAYATVHVFPYPQIQIPDSLVTIEGGTDYTIQATGSEDVVLWQWTPANWLSCIDCPQPVSSPKSTITYTLKAQNIAGCIVEKNITITVVCKDQNLFIPNTFSPNNDGMNDYFYPRGKGFTVKSFRVFSRWGILVYEQHNFLPNNQVYGWNGTYKGNVLQPDVYVYMIDVLCDNGNIITSKGNVTLLR